MPFETQVRRLLEHRAELFAHPASARLLQVLRFPQLPGLRPAEGSSDEERAAVATRAEIAFALGAALFAELLQRVPEAERYLQRVADAKGGVLFDHGALRTVAWHSGALPPGEAAFTRFLTALGYRQCGVYPLPRLRMTGRSYVHADLPEAMPQYFVSELHPERFSEGFQLAVSRVIGRSADPLSPSDIALVERLRRDRQLPMPDARILLDALLRCFGRQHAEPQLSDYEALKAESAEMAWIATEGNVFNHATDRVADVQALADALKTEGYTVKDKVEISATGRVRQTALRAAQVQRRFVQDGHTVLREVPGSFYEFISRDRAGPDAGAPLDLGFDSGNATGIFKMTAAEASM